MNQAMLVSEPALYKLVGRSTIPETKKFDRSDNMLRHLAADEKIVTPHQVRALAGLHHRSSLISESGLYSLINRSDKPEARPPDKTKTLTNRVDRHTANRTPGVLLPPPLRNTATGTLGPHPEDGSPPPSDPSPDYRPRSTGAILRPSNHSRFCKGTRT